MVTKETTVGKNNGEIKAIYALKAIAFCGVFLGHSWIAFAPISGMCAVSIFLVLSGFLYTYRYYDKECVGCCKIKELIHFTIKKVKWLWWLQIFTTIVLIPFCVIGEVTDAKQTLSIKIIINFLMLNGWVPVSEISINRVSWYMSSQVLCVFLFPLVIRRIKKISIKQVKVAVIILLVAELLLALLFAWLKYSKIGEISYERLLYTFPAIRFIDFLLGCNVGAVCRLQNKKIESIESRNGFMLLSVLAVVFANYISELVVTEKIYSGVFTDMFVQNAVFAIPVCLLVYMFAGGNNAITDALTNNFIIHFGKLTPYMFLIHNVVFEYLGRLLWRMAGEESYLKYRIVVNCSVGLILTIVLAQIYRTIILKIEKHLVAVG